jgi:hypothetical protein
MQKFRYFHVTVSEKKVWMQFNRFFVLKCIKIDFLSKCNFISTTITPLNQSGHKRIIAR